MEFLKNVKCGELIKIYPQSKFWYEKGRKVKGTNDLYYIYIINDSMERLARTTVRGYKCVFDHIQKPF